METTANFVDGLKAAYKQMTTQLNADQAKALTTLFSEKGKSAMKEVHVRVRAQYVRQKARGVIGRIALNTIKSIDWPAVVKWIIDNWATILKIVMMVVPFIL